MTKRLTEKQKEEIVKSFKAGKTIDSLSEKYGCTNTTIIRNLKKSLGDSKFKESLNITKSLEEKSRKNKNNPAEKQKSPIFFNCELWLFIKLSKRFLQDSNLRPTA